MPAGLMDTLNPPRDSAAPIRVAVLDDHEAVRAGLQAILGHEPDMLCVGAAANESELDALLERAHPSIVVLDLFHPGRDGLLLSLRIGRRPGGPRVVLYSGRAGRLLTVAAVVAGVHAVVGKSATSAALLQAIRDVASDSPPPAVSLSSRRTAAARLDPADHAILAMRLARASWAEIADTLALADAAVAERAAAIVARLVAPLSPAESLSVAG